VVGLALAGLVAVLPGDGPEAGAGAAAARGRASSGAWRVEPVPTAEAIHVVRVDPAAGNLWALTGRAIHRRRADGTWAEPLRIEAEGGLASMYVVRPGLLYGTSGGQWTIERYRDGAWSTIGRFDRCVGYDLPIDGLGQTVAAGCSYYSGLATWSAEDPGTLHDHERIAPSELAVVGPGTVLTLGVSGLRLVRPGAAEPVVIPAPADGALPRLLWADRERIVTASRDGEFHHAAWDPATGRVGEWTVRRAPGPVHLTGLGGPAPDDLVAVGRGGAIVEFDGRAWSAPRSPTTADLSSVAAGAGGIWAGGAGGTLLHRPAR
jgi:hypothetical protein